MLSNRLILEDDVDMIKNLLADFASWNVNLTQRRVAYRSHYMNEFSEF